MVERSVGQEQTIEVNNTIGKRFIVSRFRHAAFEKVITDEQILRFICVEMLSAVCRDLNSELPPARQTPFHLIIDLSGTASSSNIQLLKQSSAIYLFIHGCLSILESLKS